MPTASSPSRSRHVMSAGNVRFAGHVGIHLLIRAYRQGSRVTTGGTHHEGLSRKERNAKSQNQISKYWKPLTMLKKAFSAQVPT